MNVIPELSKDEEAMALMLRSGLLGVPKTPSMIARELRLMAAASEPYGELAEAPPYHRQIWRAAAELLDRETVQRDTRLGRGSHDDILV